MEPLATLSRAHPIAAHPADDAERYDIYRLIHKGLRACMAATLTAVGRVDGGDPDELQACLAEVRGLLGFCALHLEKEEAFVHPALEARRPGAAAPAAHQHLEHGAQLEHLQATVGAVEAAAGSARGAALQRLYRALALFVADNLTHMEWEESQNNAQLWAAFDDGELQALERSITASVPPPERARVLRWIIPHVTPGERAALLGGMARGLPAEAFAGVMAMLRPHLGEGEWRRLSAALAA